MGPYVIDDDVIDLLSELAQPRQFEGMSDVLRRFLKEIKESRTEVPSRGTEHDHEHGAFGLRVPGRIPAQKPDPKFSMPGQPDFNGVFSHHPDVPPGMGVPPSQPIRVPDRIRAPSPDPRLWVSRVPELKSLPRMTTWRAICEHLQIEVGGDSARRRLQEWVEMNRPQWPKVPDA